MGRSIQLGLCVALIVILAFGCGPRQADKGSEPNKPVDKGQSGTGDEGGSIDSTKGGGALTQRQWEKKLAALWKDVHDARAIAKENELAAKRKEEAAIKSVNTFLGETWRPGTSLSGWIGIVGGIRETTEKFEGKPALTALLSLDVASIQLINYDPDKKKWTGLEKEFEALKKEQVVRVWGRIHSVNQAHAEVTHFIVTRIDPADLAKERAELLAKIDKMQSAAAKLGQTQEEILSPKIINEFSVFKGFDINRYCAELATTFPDFQPAVGSFNAFKPFDVKHLSTQCDSWSQMLKTKRFAEDLPLPSEQAALDKAATAAEEQVRNKSLIAERFQEGFRQKRNDPKGMYEDWKNLVPRTYSGPGSPR